MQGGEGRVVAGRAAEGRCREEMEDGEGKASPGKANYLLSKIIP